MERFGVLRGNAGALYKKPVAAWGYGKMGIDPDSSPPGVPFVSRIARLLLIKPQESREIAYFTLLFALVGFGMAIGRGSADALFQV